MNLIIFKSIIILLFLSLFSSSCSKAEESENMATENDLDIYFTTHTTDHSTNQATGVIWKNGEIFQTIAGDPISYGSSSVQLFSLWVDGSDVYAGGWNSKNTFPAQRPTAKVWKNGVSMYDFPRNYSGYVDYICSANQNLDYVVNAVNPDGLGEKYFQIWHNDVLVKSIPTDGFPFRSSILSGGDLYTLTTEEQTDAAHVKRRSASVRKNNQVLYVLPTSEHFEYASGFDAIQIIGNDIYTGGYSRAADGRNIATIWKNGQELYAPTKSSSKDARINYISVVGTDIYSGGNQLNADNIQEAIVWKNNTRLYNFSNGDVASIVASNGNVYTLVNAYPTQVVVYKNNLKLYVCDSNYANNLIVVPRKKQ